MSGETICSGCRDGAGFELPITMAFQPIVDVASGTVYAQEALVRGVNGEGAGFILDQVSAQNRYAFDQSCRVKAIELAAQWDKAHEGERLSINFLPNAVYEPRACIRLTLATAMRFSFPLNRIIFEFTETEKLDTNHLLNILRSYRAMGFMTAIDDFGSGYAGLSLLSNFQPDLVKIDMELIRNIDKDRTKRIILASTLRMLQDLEVKVICEGVETAEEFEVLRDMGVSLIQGYFFGKPSLRQPLSPNWPQLDAENLQTKRLG